MERVEYLEERERTLSPAVTPNCYQASDVELKRQRTVCVDRIFRLGAIVGALDTTCFAAVRLFDRCVSVAGQPLAKTNMLMLAIAAFDIVHKASDSDIMQPSMKTYYVEGFSKGPNDYTVPFEKFGAKITEIEVTILNAVHGEPVLPAAQDYMAECYPRWYEPECTREGRRASLLCSAFLYVPQSTAYTAEQIAAAAACYSTGGRPLPSDDMMELCHKLDEVTACKLGRKMVQLVDELFSIGRECSLYYMYYDLYSS